MAERSHQCRPGARPAFPPLSLLLVVVALAEQALSQSAPAEYSFGAPFNDINPFTGQRQISNWDLGGTAVAHRSFVRLTPEAQGSKGWMTSQQPIHLAEWSAMLELRASGASPHLYGDGLAIWVVKAADHIEGPVFAREDKWNGLGIFFDTFQNVDHSHHHKHPYIYAMMNDGTKTYIPDADKTSDDKDKMVLPGSHENSGCSYEFRYSEDREDVSVLNHTRVHFVYRNRILRLRLQQTSAGVAKEWFQCIDMKDVDVPSPAYFGISAATGDLVDNHDVVQFVVRPLDGITDPDADYDAWAKEEEANLKSRMAEFDLRPPEALQRDYQRVIRSQASAIKELSADVETLKQQLEFQLASLSTGISTTKRNLDSKAQALDQAGNSIAATEELAKTVEKHKKEMTEIRNEVVNNSGGGGWKFPFVFLFIMIVALGGVGYNRYVKLYGKSHLP